MTNKLQIGSTLLDSVLSEGIPTGNITVIKGRSTGKSEVQKKEWIKSYIRYQRIYLRTEKIIKMLDILKQLNTNEDISNLRR